MSTARALRPFTGRHAAAVIVAFFGVVIAVNVTMARLASSTFGGTVVDNSYVASQRFNSWLDKGAEDKALGWKAGFGRGVGGAAAVTLAGADGAPLTGAKVTIHAEHPLGMRPPQDLALRETAPGTYQAVLPAGRWRVWLSATARGHEWRTVGEVH